MDYLVKHLVPTASQPPYNPDFVALDFFLFSRLKRVMKRAYLSYSLASDTDKFLVAEHICLNSKVIPTNYAMPLMGVT